MGAAARGFPAVLEDVRPLCTSCNRDQSLELMWDMVPRNSQGWPRDVWLKWLAFRASSEAKWELWFAWWNEQNCPDLLWSEDQPNDSRSLAVVDQ